VNALEEGLQRAVVIKLTERADEMQARLDKQGMLLTHAIELIGTLLMHTGMVSQDDVEKTAAEVAASGKQPLDLLDKDDPCSN